MHARVVRFTDVEPERIEQIMARIAEQDGPPEGVESTGLRLFFDASQGTAIFVGFFEDEGKMRAADEFFERMDSSDTPGTRASVDLCEVVIEADE
jgi:hypothetical protein